jgi:hypothetical protein
MGMGFGIQAGKVQITRFCHRAVTLTSYVVEPLMYGGRAMNTIALPFSVIGRFVPEYTLMVMSHMGAYL